MPDLRRSSGKQCLHEEGLHGRWGSEVRNGVEKELPPKVKKCFLFGIDFRSDFWHRFGTDFDRFRVPVWVQV